MPDSRDTTKLQPIQRPDRRGLVTRLWGWGGGSRYGNMAQQPTIRNDNSTSLLHDFSVRLSPRSLAEGKPPPPVEIGKLRGLGVEQSLTKDEPGKLHN